MTTERAMRLAQKWSNGLVCSLREGEAAEYHKMVLDMLRAKQEAEKNEPLTLDELREMDGEPVWVVNSKVKRKDGFCDVWALVSCQMKDAESVRTIYHFENYGEYWLAYRRKPEEEAK